MAATPAGVTRSFPASIPWIDRLPRFWGRPSDVPRDFTAILAIVLIGGAAAIAGAVPTRIFGHDIFILLDGGWRILNGQRPQVDFSPGIGPLSFWFVAAGLKLANNSVHGVGIADGLMAVLAGGWSYLLTRRRLPWMPAALISCCIALFAADPNPVGFPLYDFSHAMTYNRFGYALLGVLMAESFIEMQPAVRSKILLRGFSSGAIIILLILIKPSYAAVGALFLAISVPTRKPVAWRLIGMAAGLAMTTLGWLTYLRFDLAAVLSDLTLMAGAKSGALSAWGLKWAIFKGLPEFIWIGALALLVARVRGWRNPAARSIDILILALTVFVGQALILATNAQPSGYPLNAIFAILLAERGRLAADDRGPSAITGIPGTGAALILMGILCFVPAFARNAFGLAGALAQRFAVPESAQTTRFQPPHLAGLILYDVPDGTSADIRSNGRVYVNYVEEGVELIRKFSRSSETVYTLDFTDPFSYALLRRPAHGGMTCMDYNAQFSDRFKPSADWIFGAADIVMVPKRPSATDQTTQALERNYLTKLENQYRMCAESDWWKLYKRPSSLRGCTGARRDTASEEKGGAQ